MLYLWKLDCEFYTRNQSQKKFELPKYKKDKEKKWNAQKAATEKLRNEWNYMMTQINKNKIPPHFIETMNALQSHNQQIMDSQLSYKEKDKLLI